MKKELFDGLTDEQIAKAKACKNQEELLALAKEEGIELSEEQLTAVNGGFCSSDDPTCPHCGTKDNHNCWSRGPTHETYTCNKCGRFFSIDK